MQYADEFRGVWRDGYHGLDLRAAVDFPCHPEAVMAQLHRKPTELARPRPVSDTVYDAHMDERPERIDMLFEIDTAGRLQGFVGYFDATLCEGIHIASYPCYPTCHWENWNWPVSPPLDVRPGQRIVVTLQQPAKVSAASWTMSWTLE